MKTSRRRFLSGAAAIAAGGAAVLVAADVAGGAEPAGRAPEASGSADGAGRAGESTDRGEPDVPGKTGERAKVFQVYPIGVVECAGEPARIRILDSYVEGLLGSEGWSHVQVFWWFDRNDTPQRRRTLRVHPQGNRDNPLTGVFACRAPVRPNLIALTTCRLISVEGPIVTIDRIDALEGTPVIDLKPLIPSDLAVKDLRVPKWASEAAPKRDAPAPPADTRR